MIKDFCYIFLLCSFQLMESQNWDSIRAGKFTFQIERVLFDEVHNQLIVSSKFNSKVGNLPARGICLWNSIKWDSLAGGINTHDQIFNPNNPSGMALACTEYHGKLLVGGMFQSVGGINATSLALWDGVKWDSLPKRAFKFDDDPVQVTGFLKKGNLLYITGSFDTIAGQPAYGLAVWDGINFSPVSVPPTTASQGIWSIVEYQNELYITGGLFNFGTYQARDILKFDGTIWRTTTGGGLTGGFSSIGNLIVYNNELYASGHFTKSDGNPGNHIMKWNGTSWKDVGFGDQLTFVSIKKMLVHHNKLWVFGGFDEVAGSFASNVAVYDGTNWCGLSDTLDNTINSATVYNDTIYIGGGFWTANSDSVPYIAKLKNPALFNNCVNVGINETSESLFFSVYPNPTTSILHIPDKQNQLQYTAITISNNIGQTVLQMPYSSSIDVTGLAPGCYLMSIISSSKSVIHAKFMKE